MGDRGVEYQSVSLPAKYSHLYYNVIISTCATLKIKPPPSFKNNFIYIQLFPENGRKIFPPTQTHILEMVTWNTNETMSNCIFL